MEGLSPIDRESAQEVLEEFLSYPLDDGFQILQKFAALPGAIFSRGQYRLERYVFVPGTRKRSVVLVAHVDTVWDQTFPWTGKGGTPRVEGDIVSSTDPKVGIGADDRAGCAILWMLRESGHSLLLLDGEEAGALGTKYLIRQNPTLFKTLNRHAYMLEMDQFGTGACHYCEIPNSRRFCRFIERSFCCKPSRESVRTDIACLCREVCGANIPVGVYHEHSPAEELNISQWMNTYETLCRVLGEDQSVFRTSIIERGRRFLIRKFTTLKGKLIK